MRRLIIPDTLKGFAIIIVFFATFSTAMADEVTLDNGDRITGEVVKFSAGELTFKADYARPMTIKANRIKGLSTEKTVELHLKDGQVLKGRLGMNEEGRLTIVSDVGVSAAVEWKDVETINPPPVKWTGNVTVGATVENGNTDRASASVGAQAERKTKKDKLGMRFLHNYAEEEGVVVTRNTYGALKYAYYFYRGLYGYVSIEMLSDEFRDLNLRTIVGPGLGYQIWDDDKKSLFAELGVVYVNDDYDVAEDEDSLDGRGAVSFSYTLLETVSFSDDFVYYHDFDDDTFQLRNEAAITSALTQSWALRLAHILLYDDDPQPGISDTDNIYIMALQYKF